MEHELIFTASIIAGFIGGMIALFAPCCITVLLPAYLGSVFTEKKNILTMTFVFFVGISVILVPIGLGAAGLAELFKSFHTELYIWGGLFMFLLAVLSLLGKGMSILPMPKRPKKLDVRSYSSVFVLGIFSGAATSCCAPVLAGAMTLAVLSGAFWNALIVSLAYVFGMTLPLFLAAYFYDKFKIDKSRLVRGKIWKPEVLGKTFYIHSTNLISAGVFAVMGGLLIWLALSGRTFWSPEFQAKLGSSLQVWSEQVLHYLMVIPDFVWFIGIAGLFVFFIRSLSKKSL